MISRLYKLLYTRFGGRPWTYITREATRRRPLEALLWAFLLGNVFANVLPWSWELLAGGFIAAGVVVGHIFWGAPPSTWEK